MTPHPHRFGRAGGPSMAQIKEYSTLQSSSTLNLAMSGIVLGDASAILNVNASVDSYYLLWGVTATTSHAGAFFGLLYDSTDQYHTASTTDASVYLGFGGNNQGPFFWNTEQPIKIKAGSGIKLDKLAGTNNTLITVLYSVVHPMVGKPLNLGA